MREVAHRARNQLSVIQAMAKQTAQSSTDDKRFPDDFQRRLIGLARSTDLLLHRRHAGISFADVLDAQIEPFRPDTHARFTCQGPDLRSGRRGFGSTVIEQLVATALGATVTRTLNEDGIEWRFSIPGARFTQAA